MILNALGLFLGLSKKTVTRRPLSGSWVTNYIITTIFHTNFNLMPTASSLLDTLLSDPWRFWNCGRKLILKVYYIVQLNIVCTYFVTFILETELFIANTWAFLDKEQ
jgi:hypothetical protein